MWFPPSRHLIVLVLTCTPWSTRLLAQDRVPLDAIDLTATLSQNGLASKLVTKRVIFVGETHDRYDHHLKQLEIIRQLHQLDPNLAIGVEYLQQPFQAQVDDYISGRTDEQEFLRSTEYYQGWGYDYRLYAPIFRFARENHIPVRALNVPRDLAPQVAKVGIEGLSVQQRASVPKEIAPPDETYKARLKEAFQGHGTTKPEDFDHFVEAQLVWDEGMAENAAAYLNANPERRMVVLAGSGHIVFGEGIPRRLERRTRATYAIVLNPGDELAPHMGDYLVLGKEQTLPPTGVLGVGLEEKDGECRIRSVNPGGAGKKAGLKSGDVITEIDGYPIHTIADMRLALWDKKPKDRTQVSVQRKRFLVGSTTQTFEVELAAAK